jgi:hypothetical protein
MNPPEMEMSGRPVGITLFNVYAALMATMYLAVAVVGVFFLVADPSTLEMKPDDPPPALLGGIFLAAGAPLMLIFAAAPFLPRRKWVWIADIVLIGIGMTSACCLPLAIPVLIFWLKPEVRTRFGMA